MEKTFTAQREDHPGTAWLERFRAGRDEAERWYLGDGETARPSASECRAALLRYMPELRPPSASIFCACNREARPFSRTSCAFRRSVMSRVTLARPISLPVSSRIAELCRILGYGGGQAAR